MLVLTPEAKHARVTYKYVAIRSYIIAIINNYMHVRSYGRHNDFVSALNLL